MRTRAFWAAIAAAGATAACGGTTDDSAGLPPPAGCASSTTVLILDVGFGPPCVTVPAGATLRFQNVDTVAHTATGYSEQGEVFDSRVLLPGQEFTHTFAASPAVVQLRCSLHPSAIGEVVVE